MNAHAQLDYHAKSLTRMQEFLARYRNPSEEIHNKFDKEIRTTIEKNRHVIESLFRIVILLENKVLLFEVIVMTKLCGLTKKPRRHQIQVTS